MTRQAPAFAGGYGEPGTRLPYNSITSRFDKPFGLELMAERLKALRHSKGTNMSTSRRNSHGD